MRLVQVNIVQCRSLPVVLLVIGTIAVSWIAWRVTLSGPQFMSAVESMDYERARLLASIGADKQEWLRERAYLDMLGAMATGDIAKIKKLIELGALNASFVDPTSHGSIWVAMEGLQHRIGDGDTLLHVAVRMVNYRDELLTCFGDGGAFRRGFTSFNIQMMRDHPTFEVVSILVHGGCDVTAVNDRGETPLAILDSNGYCSHESEIVRSLLGGPSASGVGVVPAQPLGRGVVAHPPVKGPNEAASGQNGADKKGDEPNE